MENKTNQVTKQKEPVRKGFFASYKARLFTMVMALASLMSLSAFAADGDPATISSLITEANTSVPAVMTLVWSLMTANPLMTFFIVSVIVGVGFRFIRCGIRSVR